MFFEELRELEEGKLLREIKSRTSPQGPKILINGRECINFSSNDYLGFANHPYIIEAAKRAMQSFGFGSGASRLLAGGTSLHRELENKIADFKGTESALVFNSGYSANTGIIPAIAGEGDVIFSDGLNHASIIDGCRLSRARTFIYRHRDIEDLKQLLKSASAKRKIVITDTVFSMDGDIAPLRDIYEICERNDAVLYIDDAHAAGVLGSGKGALKHFNIKPEPWIIQMGTFSKALGSFGAFVAGSRDVVAWISNTARSFIFSTALPSCVIAASIAALGLIENDSILVKRLWANRDKLAKGINDLGYEIMGSETPIIPIKTGDVENTLRISQYLYDNGVFAPAIRPPTVKTPRIRITITAAHTDEDIERLIELLRDLKPLRSIL